jgi:Fe-S-cluster-containing hydrogenase component 2
VSLLLSCQCLQAGKRRISVAYEGCLECGSCRIACPHLNIEWRFPTGDAGSATSLGESTIPSEHGENGKFIAVVKHGCWPV